MAVLCSGRGTNLQAIIDAVRRGTIRARIALVIADRLDAFALERARKAAITAVCVDPKSFTSRDRFEESLVKLLKAHHVSLICLAGFMRVLSPEFVHRFPHRILNIHPALLPAFPGAHAVRDAMAWGAKVTGVTVHLVDEEVDHGPILLQEAVAIHPGEPEEELLERVHRVEHKLYPEAIRLMLEGQVRVQGRTTSIGARKGKRRPKRAT